MEKLERRVLAFLSLWLANKKKIKNFSFDVSLSSVIGVVPELKMYLSLMLVLNSAVMSIFVITFVTVFPLASR